MAALGKILRKGTSNGQSAFNSVKYEPLNQDVEDNEQEDDDVVFVQDGKHNGEANGKQTDIQQLRNSLHEDVQMGELGLQKAKVSRKKPDVEVKVMKRGKLTTLRIMCFICTLIGIIICMILFTMVIPKLHENRVVFNQTDDWKVVLSNIGTESCVRLFDVDEDGRDDILFGATADDVLDDAKLHRDQMKAVCQEKKLPFPCVGKIFALRGYDGKVLWKLNTYMESFEINCGNIDINKDGKMDCIATGRMSTVAAFDPRNGTMFWEGDTSVLKDTWNTYNVIILQDLNGDGVGEVVMPHGGEPSFSKMEKDRFPGRLILLDGATGKSMGRYLEMPDSKELYISPVLHTKKDGAQYILFGNGGESVPGSFMAISVPDFYRYVKELKPTHKVNNTKGDYKHWEKKLHYMDNTKILEIYKGTNKGVMVPPLLIDMNGDGSNDILMSAYDNVFILYNGETLEQIWKAEFPGFETYSTPAPAYFNDDDVMDFMLHISHGEWPNYEFSYTIILDGTSGYVLWSFNTSFYEMSSDLVVRLTEENRDAYIFRVQGRGEELDRGMTHGIVKQDGDKPVPSKRTKRAPAFGRKSYRRPPTNPPPPVGPGYDQYASPYNNNNNNYRQPPYKEYYQENYYDTGRQYPGGEYNNDNPGTGMMNDESEDGQEDEGIEIEFPAYESECSHKSLHTSEFFIMDRSTVTQPIRVLKFADFKYNITLTDQDREKADNRMKDNLKSFNKKMSSKLPEMKDPLCTVMTVQEVNTAAVGDVDGDGTMDLIALINLGGNIQDERLVFIRERFETQIIKINLDKIITDGEGIDIEPRISEKISKKKEKKSLRQMNMRPPKEQKWTQYLGQYSDSIYH